MFFPGAGCAAYLAVAAMADDKPLTAEQATDLAIGHRPMSAPPPKPKVQERNGPVTHPADTFPERARR